MQTHVTTPTTLDFIHSLSGLDWVLLAIVVFSTGMAFRRGFVRVLFSLLGLGIGVFAASLEYGRVAEFLHLWITSLAACKALGFMTILMGVMVVFSIAAGLVRKTLQAVGLGFFDRLLGGLLGLGRGALIGVTVMVALVAFVPKSAMVKNSRLAPYFLTGSHAVSFVMPGQLKEQMASGSAVLLQQTPELVRPQSVSLNGKH